MLRVVVVGAGAHFTSQHGPALARFVERYPGRIRLAGVCDLVPERAKAALAMYGFEESFTSVEEMLGKVKAEAALVLMDCEGKQAMLEEIMRRGVPMTIEKPLGKDIKEARALAETAKRWKAEVMVSMNRRFDPGVLAANEWMKDKGPIRSVAGRMLRDGRREDDFVWGTGVHLLDAMVAVAGPMKVAWKEEVKQEGGQGRVAGLKGDGGVAGMVEIMPACGRTEEWLQVTGGGYCVEVWTGSMHPWSVRGYTGNKLELKMDAEKDEALEVRNGTYKETEEFMLAASEGRRLPGPTIEEAMIASELAAEIGGTQTR